MLGAAMFFMIATGKWSALERDRSALIATIQCGMEIVAEIHALATRATPITYPNHKPPKAEERMSYVVKLTDPGPKVRGEWYWSGVTKVAGIGFASWVCDTNDAAKYRTKREATRIRDAHRASRPKTADYYTVEKI